MYIRQLLAWFARKIIAKYKPLVIGVTGSVGKTSTRHAIAAALSIKYRVREPQKNYNNEIGIPLTIIGTAGLDAGGGNWRWFRIFFHAVRVLYFPQAYPEVLVLEYGIDHPGDMDALLRIVQPRIAIITTIGVSHKEFFNTEAEIAFEKGKIAAGLPSDGVFIYNVDDANVVAQTKRTQARCHPYSIKNSAETYLKEIHEQLSLQPSTTLTVQTTTRTVPVTIPVLGTAHTAAVVAAVAVSEILEIETDLIQKGLANYRPVPGRLTIIAGIKRSTIIDDTYNAAPLSMLSALDLLARFPGDNKIAVLGDMLELGDVSHQAHYDIGVKAASVGLSKLVTIGPHARTIVEGAIAAGFPQTNILSFDTVADAKQAMFDLIVPNSIILLKGSQSIRVEKLTKEIMAEPMRAPELLCRQYGKWLET